MHQIFIKELLKWLKSYDLNYIATEKFFTFGKQHVDPKAIKFNIFYAKYYTIYVLRSNSNLCSSILLKSN